VREITRKINEQINSVRRELANLLSIGIISSDTTNNRLYYEVNQNYEYYKALAAIFGDEKLVAAKASKGSDTQSLKSLGNVDLALLTGQFTRDERSGVDLLIVGDVNQTKVTKYVTDLEAKEGKEIRYAVMPLDEYRYRQQVKDRFLTTVMASKKQVLVDKGGELEPAGKLDKKDK